MTVTYDPKSLSFKQSMIVIVFTGMWLESLMHLQIVKYHGEKVFKKYDFKSYEEKLELLGIKDQELLSKVERFRKIRKQLVHEKACFDSNKISIAQNEAENANNIMLKVSECMAAEVG